MERRLPCNERAGWRMALQEEDPGRLQAALFALILLLLSAWVGS